jgi:hypothetical protein
MIAASGLSEAQIQVLVSLADTFLPALDEETGKKLAKAYVETVQAYGGSDAPVEDDLIQFVTSAASCVRTADEMIRIISTRIPQDVASQIKLVLYLLTTGWGTTLLLATTTGVPFAELDFKEREAGVLRLANSAFDPIRMLFKAVKAITTLPAFGKSLAVAGYFSKDDVVNGKAVENPLWKVLQYPGFPNEKEIPAADAVWRPVFEE